MHNLPIRIIPEGTGVPLEFFQQIEEVLDEVRRKAFQLFQKRGGQPGNEINDWLEAERLVCWTPPAELIDREHEFELKIELPGVNPKDLTITAMPDTLVVQAQTTHRHKQEAGHVRFCDFNKNRLFRNVEFPSAVDVERLIATLENGILRIVAPKVGYAPPRRATAA